MFWDFLNTHLNIIVLKKLFKIFDPFLKDVLNFLNKYSKNKVVVQGGTCDS
jgi:hypothetical protein